MDSQRFDLNKRAVRIDDHLKKIVDEGIRLWHS